MSDWESVASGTSDYPGEESLTAYSDESGVPFGGVLDDHLWLYSDGSVWDLGPASADADADGVADSLTRRVGGSLTVYTDRDLDGQVDRIAEVDGSGGYRVSDLDPETGLWSPSTLGRLG